MSPLGPLADEPPEPMSREDFVAVQKRLKESWDGHITISKREVERMLDEIRWLKRRLQRVEDAVEPLVEYLRARGCLL